MNLGEVLKQLRIEKGLTQEELGNIIGKSKQMIINYEKNKSNIPMNVLKNIATALDTTIDSILIFVTNKNNIPNKSISDIGIFLSFFNCTLLPDSTNEKIVFLDEENKKYILNDNEFREILELLKPYFKERIYQILLTYILKNNKIKFNKENLINLIEDIAKNIGEKENKKNINIIDVFSKLGKK